VGVFDASTSPPKECPLLAALIRPKRRMSHVWMAPACKDFFACGVVACGHVSGLCMRSHMDRWP
jgi:hypothetical protein